MKATWKGNISIGLVSIPIKIYPSAKTKKLPFRMLCKKHSLPIHYKMICENGEELSRDEITTGIEFEKNNYFILDPEEIKKLKPKKTENLEISEFVDINEIKPIYYEKNYYIAPEKKKDRAYFLIKELMEEMKKAAIGKIVIKNREYLCAIQPFGGALLLSILHYYDEINDIGKIENLDEKPDIGEKERELGRMMIEKYSSKKFDLSKYRDTFMDELKELIKKKIEGKEIVVEEKSKETNLMEALKATIGK